MQRLFWTFFIIIWLTMAASIAGLFALSNLFSASPVAQDVERGQRSFALETAARLLSRHGVDVAKAFVDNIPAPVALSMSRTGVAEKCVLPPKAEERWVVKDGECYKLAVVPPDASFLSEAWPQLVPWLSALLAAALAAYWLTRYLIQPITHLRDGLSALARGRFDIRIAGRLRHSRDEIAALMRDFDASAARLEDLQRTQQRLFHDVSHELRSPLSRLTAALGVLQQNPAKLGPMMERMGREIERIDGLVGEILTLARLTNPSVEGREIQTLDIIDLLNDIAADAAFEAEPRNIRIVRQGAESFTAEVEGELIYRALENVIRNALKYSPDGAEVSLWAETEADRLRVIVTDQGPGVSEHELEHIFEPFSRANAAATDGYGLGLAIAKQAVERHGGRISAARAEGGGLAVTLEIARAS